MRRIYNLLASFNLGLWLTAAVMLLLAAGSFSDGASEAGSINDLPLLQWLREAPLSSSWWLWGAVGVLALLALNTLLCSIESLRMKLGRGNLLAALAPQMMHLGFLLIILAHLFSASGGMKRVLEVREGSALALPGGDAVRFERITAVAGMRGMLTSLGAELRFADGSAASIAPNRPAFRGGFGIYIKDAVAFPFPAALVEVHREPGARWALAGALLFLAGNLVLLARRR
ncbi:MAG TPA: cytochrome C biogenesis protein ResB [Verrucomicrobiae bacterium]|nr:cytochrome C biogenesis protein ResB [Verrucomicrobiae bacterium]